MIRLMVRWIALIALLSFGCDRAPVSPNAPIVNPGRPVVQFTPITQLPPNRIVHVAIDSLGNVLYTLETEKGTDGVIIVGENGIPRATELTSANILTAMGEAPGGNGTIQDLAAGPDGTIYFYFVGGRGRTLRACVGRFLPRNQAISVVVDTSMLSRHSEMGDSLGLARGTLVAQGNRFTLLLRHFDAWAIFNFDARRIAPGADSEFVRPYKKLMADDLELQLTQTKYELSAGPENDLFLMDFSTSALWQIDPAGGTKLRASFAGLPRDLSLPLQLKDGHLILFAADSDPVEGELNDVLRRSMPRTTYPAILNLNGKEITAIGRDDLRVFTGFPTYAMRLHQFLPASDGTFVAYDVASGQLMRLNFTTVR